jgi:hypothetical protein
LALKLPKKELQRPLIQANKAFKKISLLRPALPGFFSPVGSRQTLRRSLQRHLPAIIPRHSAGTEFTFIRRPP